MVELKSPTRKRNRKFSSAGARLRLFGVILLICFVVAIRIFSPSSYGDYYTINGSSSATVLQQNQHSSSSTKFAASTPEVTILTRSSLSDKLANVSLPLLSNNSNKLYKPSEVENYVYNHVSELKLDTYDPRRNYGDPKSRRPRGCQIYLNPNATTPDVYQKLQQFRNELKTYNQLIDDFELPDGITDLRHHLEEDICSKLELHTDGLTGIFQSGVLSNLESGAIGNIKSGIGEGYLEPLLPPMRDPEYCYGTNPYQNLLTLGYIIHDFTKLCSQLKRHSRVVLVDMGASLNFHSGYSKNAGKEDNNEKKQPKIDIKSQPALYLTSIYEKFGFIFDHIYAFEVKVQPPDKVYEKVPQHLMGSYHWINVGVSAEPGHKLNPLTMLLERFDPIDDIIIVKLDIDTASLEVPLAFQILENPELNHLINHFYFEHHVHMKEIQGQWVGSMDGTIAESLELFRRLRQRGIAAHFWV